MLSNKITMLVEAFSNQENKEIQHDVVTSHRNMSTWIHGNSLIASYNHDKNVLLVNTCDDFTTSTIERLNTIIEELNPYIRSSRFVIFEHQLKWYIKDDKTNEVFKFNGKCKFCFNNKNPLIKVSL